MKEFEIKSSFALPPQIQNPSHIWGSCDCVPVVVGPVSSKKPALESNDELKRRIPEAESFLPLERLALSPQ